MDISIWAEATKSIEAELSRRLPQHAQEFSQRAEKLRIDLLRLDEQGRQWIATIPARQRMLISSHDAFQYFGRRYGLKVEGVQGISTASEAGLRRIPELIDSILERQVPSVFKESSVAGKLIDAIIEGASARGYKLKVGEELYSDALGPVGSDAETYRGMMAHNLRAITRALGGSTQ
jgi:manganese/zinc/iron transport system substrate-binding protein